MKRVNGVLSTLALIFLAGCGGSGVSTPGSQGIVTENPVGSHTVGTLTGAQRLAILNGIRSKMLTLFKTTTPAQFNTQLTAYAKTVPGIASVASGPNNNLNMLMSDGRWMIILGNRKEPGSPPAPYADPPPAASPTTSTPTGKKVQMLIYSQDHGGTSVQTMKKAFVAKGYTDVHISPDASLQNFAIQDADIAYVETHGGEADFKDPVTHVWIKKFAILTNTSAPVTLNAAKTALVSINESSAPGLATALNLGEVGFAMNPNDPAMIPEIAITPSYIAKHHLWKFNGKGSIVFCNVCDSDMPISAEFKKVCHDLGADAFVGFDNSVGTVQASTAAANFFDRALGTKFSIAGHRKPYDLPTIYGYLKANGYDEVGGGTGTVVSAHLKLTSYGSPVLLVPSIKVVYVVDKLKKLHILGQFPDGLTAAQHHVSINGVQLPETDIAWGPSEIVCNIPSDSTAPTFAGPIVVTALDHPSNTVNLSKFKFDFNYHVKTELGTLFQDVKFHCVVRYDVQMCRQTINDALQSVHHAAAPIQESTFSWSTGGSQALQPGVIKWTGSDTLKDILFGGTTDAQFSPSIDFDYDNRRATLFLNWQDFDKCVDHFIAGGHDEKVNFTFLPYTEAYDVLAPSPGWKMSMNDDYTLADIPGRQPAPLTKVLFEAISAKGTATMKFTNMTKATDTDAHLPDPKLQDDQTPGQPSTP